MSQTKGLDAGTEDAIDHVDVNFDAKAAIAMALKKDRHRRRIWIGSEAVLTVTDEGPVSPCPRTIADVSPRAFEIAKLLGCGINSEGVFIYNGSIRDIFLAAVEVDQKHGWHLDSITMTEAKLSQEKT